MARRHKLRPAAGGPGSLRIQYSVHRNRQTGGRTPFAVMFFKL
jgi:hypothetical protein